jgi:hypothetical protein
MRVGASADPARAARERGWRASDEGKRGLYERVPIDVEAMMKSLP